MSRLNADSRASQFVNMLLVSNKSFIMVIILAVAASLLSPVFLTSNNLLNVLRQISINAIIALGFTFVIGFAEIDLSVGAVIAFIGVVMAAAMRYWGVSVPLAILMGLAAGVLCGFLNFAVISIFALPAFVVTLATQSLFRGLVFIITGMVPITRLPESFTHIGSGYLGPIPIPVYLLVVMIVIMYIIAKRTIFGRFVIAVGGNREAARASGISIIRTRFYVYLNMGICATVAAIILTGRTASAQVNAGTMMELDAIASVVIGGTSLYGGNTNIIGTIFGAMIIGLISNGLNLLAVNTNYQIIAKGTLILLALILDSLSSKFYANIRKRQTLAELEKGK